MSGDDAGDDRTGPDVSVRPAKPADEPALRALQAELAAPTPGLLPLGIDGGAVCPVAVRERPVGYALALDTDPGYLAELVVAPDARRLGVGSLLLGTVRRRVDGPLRLTVSADDTGARAFYERHGARCVARLPGRYELAEGCVDGLLLELDGEA